MPEVALNHQNKLEININPAGEPEWAGISKGFSNLSQSVNEMLYKASYLSDGGWGSSTVTGGQYTVTLAGTRIYGDVAQDYLFSDKVMFGWGKARETQLKITRANGPAVEWDVTIARITDGGGDASGVSAVTVEFHGNGRPRVTS